MSESTNTQSWKQKYTRNKPLRKTKEQVYAGISIKWFYIAGFWAMVSIILAVPMLLLNHWLATAVISGAQIVWWAVFVIYFRTCDKFDETVLTIKYMIAELSGKHTVYKFDTDEEELMTYIPVVDIHDNGLIQYTKGRFAVLIKYNPPTDPGDQMESHLLDVQGIINRLSGDMQVNFISSSRFGAKSPLLKKFEKMILDPSTSGKHTKLIKSIYDKINNGKPSPDWAFFVYLGLGSHGKLEDAMERMDTEVPGFLDGLEEAHLSPVLLTNKMEIAKNFMQFMVPRDF